ncbi:hypothetical protein R5W24_002036 [Gemmata sp. JC717]|uniref:hypothetical protein n=1 Tax=Gemmata algarum TaxID=2975278 RepID=UPI0021BB1381|nr:hypothetical protein [Gemmata algarum]MDY3552946.1 hypothetical protein [Gemmata algarum]
MNYTVRWLPLAEARLRWLWARAFLKESIAELADVVNRLLRSMRKLDFFNTNITAAAVPRDGVVSGPVADPVPDAPGEAGVASLFTPGV